MHQNADGDTPPVLIQPFHSHHVPDLFAMHGVIGAEVERYNHVHANVVVVRCRHEVQPVAGNIERGADFIGILRIAGAYAHWFRKTLPGG